MTAFQIRKASLPDLPALMEIEAASFPTDRISRRQMRYLVVKAKGATFIAEAEGLVAGYATVLLPERPRPARLYSIAVDETFRGRGIGAALVEAVLRAAALAGHASIRLEVRANAQATVRLYRSHGFSEIARLPHYYADREDAVRMAKDLFANRAG